MSHLATVSASLFIAYLDLMDSSDTGGIHLNEEGYILEQACPDGSWNDAHCNFEVEDVECGMCQKTFSVERLDW